MFVLLFSVNVGHMELKPDEWAHAAVTWLQHDHKLNFTEGFAVAELCVQKPSLSQNLHFG